MNVKNIGVIGAITKQPLTLYRYNNIHTLLDMFLQRPHKRQSKRTYIGGYIFNMKF